MWGPKMEPISGTPCWSSLVQWVQNMWRRTFSLRRGEFLGPHHSHPNWWCSVTFITIVSKCFKYDPKEPPRNPLNFQPMILLPFHNFPVPSCSPAQRRTSAQFDPKWIQPAFGLRMALGMKPDVHRRNVLLLPSVFSTSLLDLPQCHKHPVLVA